jgi:hypothetical protein
LAKNILIKSLNKNLTQKKHPQKPSVFLPKLSHNETPLPSKADPDCQQSQESQLTSPKRLETDAPATGPTTAKINFIDVDRLLYNSFE